MAPAKRWYDGPSTTDIYLPVDYVQTMAILAERNSIALDLSYVPIELGLLPDAVRIEDVEVVDLTYAAMAITVQIHEPGLETIADVGRRLVIPLDRITSLRLRIPTLEEINSCQCIVGSQGVYMCGNCKQASDYAFAQHKAEQFTEEMCAKAAVAERRGDPETKRLYAEAAEAVRQVTA